MLVNEQLLKRNSHMISISLGSNRRGSSLHLEMVNEINKIGLDNIGLAVPLVVLYHVIVR